MNQHITLEQLKELIAERGCDARSITAIAGAPASGKSTLAETLAEDLNRNEPGSAAVFPMDGFHFDDAVLEARGQRPRKGAPFTFDVRGFTQTLKRLRANDEEEILVPVFDRALEISRNAARVIPNTVRHLIVEGNYLLLDDPDWRPLRLLYDTAVFLDVPEAVLEDRLRDRWSSMTAEELRVKLEGNDLPNALLVARNSSGADFILSASI